MILIIDNTKNLNKAYMTPKLLDYLKLIKINYSVVSKREDVNKIIYKFKDKIFGCILTGGPLCLSEELTIDLINKNIAVLLELKNIPILGICFGYQIMVASYGGKINSMSQEDNGLFNLFKKKESYLLKDLPNKFKVFQSHKDMVSELPPTFEIIGVDNNNHIQIIENLEEKRWGVQFHPEGLCETQIILKNFIDICYNLY